MIMYKITLFDCNCPSCSSGVFSCYCDDIDKFEEEWTKLGSFDSLEELRAAYETDRKIPSVMRNWIYC